MSETENIIELTDTDKIEEVVPFGKEHNLVCETRTSSLRKDFIEEALAQGVDKEESEKLAQKIRFHTNIPKKDRRDNFTLGAVEKNDDGFVDCYVNMDAISKLLANEMKTLPEEARLAAVIQSTNDTWRHERQHLIQIIKPQEQTISDEERLKIRSRHTERANKIFRITAAAGGASVAFSLAGNSNEAMFAGLAIACIGGYFTVKEAVINNYYDDPVEIDARNHSQKDTVEGRQPPFTFSLEKQSP